MEMKKRKRTLFWLYLKQVVILAVLILGEAVIFVLCFNIGMNMGVILPANAAESYLREKETELAETEPFAEELIPDTCSYAIFDEQGRYQEGNMEAGTLEQAEELAANPSEEKSQFMVIRRREGYCVIHYPIMAQFTNPTLYRLFPRLELMLLVLFAFFMILLVIGSAYGFRKKLKRELSPLLEEIEQVKRQELNPGKNSSKIMEFDELLTALNDMKEALSRSLTAEWETEQRRRENISALAHDIKTPLTIIKGNAELMKEETELLQLQQQAELVNRNVDEIESYIKLLIEETKGTDTNARECELDLSELIEEIELQSISLGKVQGMAVTVEKQHTDVRIIADGELLQRAVMNLVKNAIEHTDEKKGIRITFSGPEKILRIEIEDFGKGFSREALRRAKEQFYTEWTERRGAHYGLGMYFADSVAHRYGGQVEYYNKPEGAGAVVRFTVDLG